MNQLSQSYEVQSQAVQTPLQVTPQQVQVVMGIIMTVWVGAWVLSQIVKMVKGKEVERPPLI